jgi:D-glycero-beta-D-manno-heptose 1-phosphate adenylyltransferase
VNALAMPESAVAGHPYAETAARLRAELPRPWVFTHGVFDLLHAGHVTCLEAARGLGASLIVGVNGDLSAHRLCNGGGRPLNSAVNRVRIIGALAAVSATVVFDEDKPLELIWALRPDIYVKGGDHEVDSLDEPRLLAEWGGRTVIVPRVPGLSTSALVQRLLNPLPYDVEA